MCDAYQKLAKIAAESNEQKNEVLLAVAYYLYKSRRIEWVKREGLDSSKQTPNSIKASLDKFAKHAARDEDCKEYWNQAVSLIKEYNEFMFGHLYEINKEDIARSLVGESESRIIARIDRIGETESRLTKLMEKHHHWRESLKWAVVGSIVSPILIAIALILLPIGFPELKKWSRLSDTIATPPAPLLQVEKGKQ